MKSIGFISQMDNNGIILCIARLIAGFGKRTIIVDATSTQRTRYTIPTMFGATRQDQTVVQYDAIDVAIGFNNILELKKFLLTKGEDFNDYEYVIINTDREEMCEEFDIKNAHKLFFTTTYDKYELNRGIELLKYVCATKRREDTNAQINMSKIVVYTEIKSQGSSYVDDLTRELPIVWEAPDINLSYEEGDWSAFIQNEYSNKIEFKFLSKHTKEGIIDAATRILEEPKDRVIKAARNVEKAATFNRR